MSRSSAGGLGPAGGVGLEGQILAWLAAHSLGQKQLPECWVSSGLVTGVGAQTTREIDDVAALTAVGGHLLIQTNDPVPLRSVEWILRNAVRSPSAGFCQGQAILVLTGEQLPRFWAIGGEAAYDGETSRPDHSARRRPFDQMAHYGRW
jgi:hypothetical protein